MSNSTLRDFLQVAKDARVTEHEVSTFNAAMFDFRPMTRPAHRTHDAHFDLNLNW